MRIFPLLTSLQRMGIHLETLLNSKPVVFDIHPNEFIDESAEPRNIARRSDNIISYFVQDWLRAHLKTKNLGINGLKLYDEEIAFFIKRNYQFTTIKNYASNLSL